MHIWHNCIKERVVICSIVAIEIITFRSIPHAVAVLMEIGNNQSNRMDRIRKIARLPPAVPIREYF